MSYQLDWGDGDSFVQLGPVAPDSILQTNHAWDSVGSYGVRARAVVDGPVLSDWSDSLVVHISDNRKPDRPSPPALPRYRQTDSGYALTSTAADPDGDAVALRFLSDSGDTSGWSPLVASGESATAVLTFTTAGLQNVFAQARDARGDLSDLSKACSCRVLAGKVSVKWVFESGLSYIQSAAAVGNDGTIYGNINDMLCALSPDGTLLWVSDSAQNKVAASIGSDGTIYCGGPGTWAVKPDGSTKWYNSQGSGACALGADGTIYTGRQDELRALSPDGALKWGYDTDGFVNGPPAVGRDGTVFFGSTDLQAYAVDPNGNLKWKHAGDDCAPAVAEDGVVYFMSYDGYLYARRPDGDLQWKRMIGPPGYYRSATVGPDSTVVVGTMHDWIALDGDGNQVWQQPMEGHTGYSVAFGEDGTVYCTGSQGLTVLFPDHTVRQHFTSLGGVLNHVALCADGTLLVRCGEDLCALNGVCRPARQGWPAYSHDAQHTGRAD